LIDCRPKPVLLQSALLLLEVAPNKSVTYDESQIPHKRLEHTSDVYRPENLYAPFFEHMTKTLDLFIEIVVARGGTLLYVLPNSWVMKLKRAFVGGGAYYNEFES
jgi:hypothetical protein